MRRSAVIGIIFFITAILAKDFTAIGIQIWYRVNISYVAKNLCENKNKPELKCNGKCHLAKQLAKAEGESSGKEKPSLPVLKLKSLEAIPNSLSVPLISPDFSRTLKPVFSYHKSIISHFPESEDRPPCV